MGNQDKEYDRLMAQYRRIVGSIAKAELQKILNVLYASPPTAKSLREDPVVADSLMSGLQHWWARQIKLSMDPDQIKRPTPVIVRVFDSGYEEDAILKDWGGLLHRGKAVLAKQNLVHFVMMDYFAGRWSASRTFHATVVETKTGVRIQAATQKWVEQKAPKESWSPDGGMRLVPHLRGKPL